MDEKVTKALVNEVVNHLEFLGYDLEDLKSDSGFTYIAKSQAKSNLLIRIFNNITVISARWNGYQHKALRSKDFFETLNDVNKAALSKWYYDDSDNEDAILIIEADYYDYNKTTFGSFVENFELEIQTNLPRFSKFIKE